MAGRQDTGSGPGAATARTGGGRRREDLQLRPFPAIDATGPAAQREALARLRAWAEQNAEDAIDWYLRDKRRKRTGSRLLQGLAIVFAVAGTAVPLGTAAAGGSGQGWGYVLLAVAAGCKAFDHFFGLSSSWMRDIGVAHALRGELNAVRLEWAADVLRAGAAATAVPSPGLSAGLSDGAEPGARPAAQDPAAGAAPLTAQEVERQLALIARLTDAVRGRIEAETADWQTEFRASTRQLNEQGGGLAGQDRATAAL